MTDIPMAIEINCETGEVTERPLTVDEITARDAAAAAYAEEQATLQAKAAAAAIARQAAIDHAKSLGFTDDMIAEMFPALA